ncbi:hypothetical protein A9G24_08955 [Gilliamella sp. App6-5]|jgi:hypothetical protein|uniref:DUF7716 domain-containing protein n=1 Tax=Gilliamella sp. App6-5 TaxID=3120232 RepID=UPI00080E66B4|nr:hypothetical protein [Gilliamella apicola]OCG12241.1 hypothetical protein A9G24_08955 [Gilliamella apicola]
MLIKENLYSINDIINYMKNSLERDDDFCVYGVEDKALENQESYYIDDYPEVDDDGQEIYPSLVRQKHLHYLYSGQQFADVVDVVLDQKPSATIDDFIQSLNYYAENDNFLEL